MKKVFYISLSLLLLFELLNVYFIMPMPGSQDMNSIDLAYFLYRSRWFFRILLTILMIFSVLKSDKNRLWVPVISFLAVGISIYLLNFHMAADHMFRNTKSLIMASADANKVDTQRLIIGVEQHGIAKAYPIRFLGYHHQVTDTLGDLPILVTYCTVCRTGRVFEPIVNGKQETFRLVGMDHFNAMFEDALTKSWWRQATGEAITGSSKGKKLPEVFSRQTSLGEWLRLYPQSLIMQEDPAFVTSYDSTLKFESGKSKSQLTGTDSASWKNKSWVIGVKTDHGSKAYDWNQLLKSRTIKDSIGTSHILLALASDDKSFFAFEIPSTIKENSIRNDSLFLDDKIFDISGNGINNTETLKKLQASQEFWHSWRTFYGDQR